MLNIGESTCYLEFMFLLLNFCFPATLWHQTPSISSAFSQSWLLAILEVDIPRYVRQFKLEIKFWNFPFPIRIWVKQIYALLASRNWLLCSSGQFGGAPNLLDIYVKLSTPNQPWLTNLSNKIPVWTNSWSAVSNQSQIKRN